MNYYIKNILATLFYIFGGIYLIKLAGLIKPRYFVLNYHNFSKYNNYGLRRGSILDSGYADKFERQLKFLQKHFNFCYPNEFFQVDRNNKVCVLITFDDGYKDNYDIAFPILKKHNAKAVFFIVTNLIGTKKWLWHDKVRYLEHKGLIDSSTARSIFWKLNHNEEIPESFKAKVETDSVDQSNARLMMNWDEILEISNSGLIIGSHTNNHEVLSFLSVREQTKEISKSIDIINNKINGNCKYFSFPNGSFNEETLKILKSNEISYGFTSKKGVNKLVSDYLLIKRIGVNGSDSIPFLLLKLFINLFR